MMRYQQARFRVVDPVPVIGHLRGLRQANTGLAAFPMSVAPRSVRALGRFDLHSASGRNIGATDGSRVRH